MMDDNSSVARTRVPRPALGARSTASTSAEPGAYAPTEQLLCYLWRYVGRG